MASKKALLAVDDEDRISNLPDGVLCHKLSFLPTKYSVRTRVLSTRWNLLFSFVPILDFKYSSLADPSDTPTIRNNSRSFLDFVNSVFILYKASSMNKFRFYFDSFEETPKHCLIVPWISAAMDRNVQEIDVSISSNAPPPLPRNLFSSKTLTFLSLNSRFNIALPRSAYLPCLRTCHLQTVCFDADSATRFFQSCPKLEELSLFGCEVKEGVKVLHISVPTLKKLLLFVSGERYQCVLNVPNLLHFEYMGAAENEFSGLETLKSVVNVCIYYEFTLDTIEGVVVDLVRATCHVQELHLSYHTMEALLASPHSFPTFNNLTRLSFGCISKSASTLLSGLLANSPNLEFLSFYQGYIYEDNGGVQDSYMLPEHVPVCVSRHVKEIEFSCFSEWEYYFKLVEYFLKNAMVLDKMKVVSSFSCEEQLDITKKVFAFPRCSSTCKVVVEFVEAEED